MNNAVVLLAGLLPLYVVRFSLFGIPTNVFECAVWVTVLSWLVGKTLGVLPSTALSLDGERDGVRGIHIFIILFLLAAIISTFISPIPHSSLGILKGWIITPLLFGFLVYKASAGKMPIGKTLGVLPSTALSLDGERDGVRGILNSLILSGLVVALFGLSQIHGLNRIQSLYDVPNSLALFLVPVCVLAGWIGITNNRKLYQYAAVTMLIAVIFTQSAGAIIALMETMIVARVYPERSRRVRGTRIGIALAILAVTLFTLSGRFSYLVFPLTHPGTTNSITVRMQLWDIGTSLIKKHPILGIGLGQFEPAYQAELHHRFEQQSAGNIQHRTYNLVPEYLFRDPHNWILSFWLNTGLLGLLSFTALNFLAIKRRLSNSNIYQQAVALALISILIFGLFDTIYWKNDLSALWWMLIAVVLR